MMNRDLPINLDLVFNTIHEWVVDSTDITTVWFNGVGVKEAYPYCVLKVTSAPKELTPSWSRVDTYNSSRALGKEIEMKKIVDAEFSISCLFYSSLVDHNYNALAHAMVAQGALQKDHVLGLFEKANIAVQSVSDARDMPTVRKETNISCAKLDVLFNCVMSVTDYVGYIDKVQIVSNELGLDETIEIGG